jgi:hypothetical protein
MILCRHCEILRRLSLHLPLPPGLQLHCRARARGTIATYTETMQILVTNTT